jgi:hypothetical protein
MGPPSANLHNPVALTACRRLPVCSDERTSSKPTCGALSVELTRSVRGRRTPVPKTLRKRGLRNPTTALFCDSRNWCSEYSAFRNTSGSGKSAGTPRNHSCTGRNHFWPATQSARNELLGRMAVIDQATGCDHVGNRQFDLSGILLRPPAGNAKQPSPSQPRVKAPLFLPQLKA